MTSDWTQSTRALKAVVIILGVMIVAGAVVVAVELFRRAGTMSTAATGSYADVPVPLPPGARALGMAGDGDALSLLVEGRDGRQQVLTIDRRTGAVLGVLQLRPEP